MLCYLLNTEAISCSCSSSTKRIINKLFLAAGSTIKALLNDPDALEEVADLLDYKLGWYRVGKDYGMTKIELDSLKPECPVSPTKLLMEHIVGNEPYLTMKRFLEALANIKRFDVISELKEFFHGKISFDAF